MLAENVKMIEQEITEACDKANRHRDEVTLIAVTKTVDDSTTRAVADLGLIDLAENRVDKMLEKQVALKDYSQIRWHLIGNLQRRKVKTIINQIDYFHALESLSLAGEIQKRAEHIINCFVEVNVSGETSKHGVTSAEAMEFIERLAEFPKIRVVGLMTMAPLEASESEIRQVFGNLRQLQEKIANQHLDHAPCTELSMGMSNDYKIAIEQGATFIRVGSAFFK